jgi:hypothetical protein
VAGAIGATHTAIFCNFVSCDASVLTVRRAFNALALGDSLCSTSHCWPFPPPCRPGARASARTPHYEASRGRCLVSLRPHLHNSLHPPQDYLAWRGKPAVIGQTVNGTTVAATRGQASLCVILAARCPRPRLGAAWRR